MNQNLIEHTKTRQDLNSFRLFKLSGTGNILNNFVNIIPPLYTSTTDILQPLHPQAVENSSSDPTVTNNETPMPKSTQNKIKLRTF